MQIGILRINLASQINDGTCMNLSLHIISDIEKIAAQHETWNNFVNKNFDNPFILYKFVELYAKSNDSHCTPLFIIGKADKKTIGIAPLKVHRNFRINVATFVMPPETSPDFFTYEKFKAPFIDRIVDYVFGRLKCGIVDLTFPAESNSFRIFKNSCQGRGIQLHVEPYHGRRILKVDSDWELFERSRGGKFRRKIRKIQKKLDRAGLHRVICLERKNRESNVFKKILKIDRLSWKEHWRSKRRMNFDPDLPIHWFGAAESARTVPNFKNTVWFLELNNRLIAYAIVHIYKQIATIAKTSYDQRYRSYYPGIYLINSIIEALFKQGKIRMIDFMTDMEFMRTWTNTVLGRVRILAAKGKFSKLMLSFYCNKEIRKTLRNVECQFLRMI